jgi:hypothetical protein
MFQKFISYDPYLTFSSPNNTCLVAHNGEERPDTESLFYLGKEAYKYFLDGIETEEDFDEIIASYLEMINIYRQILPKKKIKCINPNGKEFAFDWNQAHDCELVNVAWQLFQQTPKESGEDKVIYAELYFFLALIEIDNAYMAMTFNPVDAVTSAIEAANALANAIAIKSDNEKLKEVRRDMAYQGAIARIRLDPKQNDKKFVFTCWQEWQDCPERYSSKASFARDMLEKCEHLVSNKKIEDWCREWEKSNSAG